MSGPVLSAGHKKTQDTIARVPVGVRAESYAKLPEPALCRVGATRAKEYEYTSIDL